MAQVTFQMKLVGMDRKKIAAAMALGAGAVAKYEGAPGFGYEALGWRLDKNSILHSPPIDMSAFSAVERVLDGLRDAGAAAEGSMGINALGLTPTVGLNVAGIMRSKQNLIRAAFHYEGDELYVRGEHAIRLCFFEATLDPQTIHAQLQFAMKLLGFAEHLTRVTAKERDTDNPKYAFRCFLLRLGFIGEEYKGARKILLQNLDGNGSFKSGFAPTKQPATEL